MVQNAKVVVLPRNEGKADKDRQESFLRWSAQKKLEFDSVGKGRRARDTADNNRLL